MDVDLNKLKVFIEVVRSGGVTAAAKKLYRTQSAVSQAIFALEKQLGHQLITWQGKQLQLTREGKQIYQAALQHVATLIAELESIKSSGQRVSGCIEIGMLNDYSSRVKELVLSKIASFRSSYPSVSFKIHFMTSGAIEEALLQRDLDMGFFINFRQMHRFQLYQVATEAHLIVTSKGYLKKVGNIKSVQDVVLADLIDIDSYFTCFTPWVLHHDPNAHSTLVRKSPSVSCPDFLSIKELILLDQGIGILPHFLIEKELRKGSILQLLPELAPLRVWVHLAVEQAKKLRLAEELFIKTLM